MIFPCFSQRRTVYDEIPSFLVASLNSTKLVVLFNDSTTDEHELSEDILAINTVFICRLQGRRAAKHKRERKEKKESINGEKKQEKKSGRKCEQNIECEIVPELCMEMLAKTIDGVGEIDL